MAQSYKFGQVEVRPQERQLLVEGRPAAVGARAFDVLMALIDHRDRVVSKNELFDLCWPGLVVEENNLHVQISTLRKICGARSVATIPGRGFRFTAELDQPDALACALPPRNHNLPAQLNSFVGREREIGEVKELLRSSRWVTLTSMGGTGKTRLSLQVAYDVLGEYPGGVWFVELAPVADPQRVAHAVASVLGVKEEGGRPVIEAIQRFALDRRMLLILDNCEHVLAACAQLAKALLQSAPGVTILASSREHLRAAGETAYPVPALDEGDSVRLFADRARAVQSSFEVTEQNAAAISKICRRLDGIPLAIELAAARIRGLSPAEIALRLDNCFRVLTGGDNANLPRQQTLRASIDWSYDLLSIPERELFRRLAVFAGGWTIDAAEAVGAGGDVTQDDVFDLLTHLVDKSLVEIDAQGERYRLLETVRQYAFELLLGSGEMDRVCARHLDYFLDLVDRARPELVGPKQGTWMSRLDQERENLLGAHCWCESSSDGANAGLRLARATKVYWISHGLAEIGYRMTVEALARPGAMERSNVRCGALFDAGQFAFVMGRYDEARRYLEESLSIGREIDATHLVAAALQPLGMACLGQGEIPAARAHLEEALALARKLGNKRNLAAAMNAIAQLYRIEGSLEQAEELYDNALVLARELDDRESLAIGMLNLAMVQISRRANERAGEMLLEVVKIAEAIASQRVGVSAIEVLAGLAAQCGKWECAARFFGAAEAQNGSASVHRDPADEAFLAPLVKRARAALGDRFDEAEARGRALTYDKALAEARAWLQPAA